MITVELTTSELVYTIGALERAVTETTEFLEESKRKGQPTQVTEFAIDVYRDALLKLTTHYYELKRKK
jgi:hypothetical protein